MLRRFILKVMKFQLPTLVFQHSDENIFWGWDFPLISNTGGERGVVLSRSRGPGAFCLKAEDPGLILSPDPMSRPEAVRQDRKIL